VKIFLGLAGVLCMIAGIGSRAIGGGGGLAGAVAGSTVGTGLFAAGLIAFGIAAVLEELQGLRRTLTEGLRHFAKQGNGRPPA
jgi:hypothetical protein